MPLGGGALGPWAPGPCMLVADAPGAPGRFVLGGGGWPGCSTCCAWVGVGERERERESSVSAPSAPRVKRRRPQTAGVVFRIIVSSPHWTHTAPRRAFIAAASLRALRLVCQPITSESQGTSLGLSAHYQRVSGHFAWSVSPLPASLRALRLVCQPITSESQGTSLGLSYYQRVSGHFAWSVSPLPASLRALRLVCQPITSESKGTSLGLSAHYQRVSGHFAWSVSPLPASLRALRLVCQPITSESQSTSLGLSAQASSGGIAPTVSGHFAWSVSPGFIRWNSSYSLRALRLVCQPRLHPVE
ncbi:hypothetical protein ACOMHN_041349 [Nucella lapillus]